MMNMHELERLVRKYYGYVVDMEGTGVEILDLLFVRDKIQRILEQSQPEDEVPASLYEHLHELDQLLWEERSAFLLVLGERELRQARGQRRSPRSHWWWYLDELKVQPYSLRDPIDRLTMAFAPAVG